MKVISTTKAPIPVGPYSQALISGNLVFTAGQIAIDPKSGELNATDIISQTSQTIFNLEAILEEAGSSLKNVIKTTCYLTDMANYQKFNEVYSRYFTEKPARSTVEVSKLPKDAMIEIEVIAEISS